MPRGLENSIIDFLNSLYGNVGWLGVLIAMTIESAAIPLPSEVIMPLAGWFLIRKGHSVWYRDHRRAWLVRLAASSARQLPTGSVRRAGGRCCMKYGKYILISPHHIEIGGQMVRGEG